jgi:hypothetical protein
VFVGKILNLRWEDMHWEQRLFYRLMGIKNMSEYMWKSFKEKDELLKGNEKLRQKIERRERLIVDMPLIALILILVGFCLCLNYQALQKLFALSD